MTDYLEIHLRSAPGNSFNQTTCATTFDRVVALATQAGFSPQEVQRTISERKGEMVVALDGEVTEQQFDALCDRAATQHNFRGSLTISEHKSSEYVFGCQLGNELRIVVNPRPVQGTRRNRPRPESQGDKK